MSVSVISNTSSLRVQRQLYQTTAQLGQVFQRLSSGQRINSASDDASGLAIADKLRSDTRVSLQGIRNLNDGLNALNVYEGALTELSSIVTRQAELANQAANGVFSYAQRQAIHLEANALSREFNRVLATTSYNGINLGSEVNRELSLQSGGSQISLMIASKLDRLVGNGTFSNANTVVSDYSTRLLGDFNGDGNLDFLSGLNDQRVVFGNGNGTFRLGSTIAEFQPQGVGDFDGDGRDDVIILGVYGSSTANVSIFLSNGNGSFRLSTSHAAPETFYTSNSLTGDFNGDGNLDFVTGSGGTGSRYIYYGNGRGQLTSGGALAMPGPYSPQYATVADLNGDGYQDLAVTPSAGQLHTFFGSAQGLSQTPLNPINLPIGVSGLQAGDVNGDGRDDLITVQSAEVRVFLSTGGGFSAGQIIAQPTGAAWLEVSDFNSDGVLDIGSVSAGSPAYFNAYFGNGNGTFVGSGVSTVMASGSTEWTFGDFNNDSALDALIWGNVNETQIQLGRTSQSTTTRQLDLRTEASARNELGYLKQTLERVEREIGAIGAAASRTAVAIANLGVASENFRIAESQIRDSDTATEASLLVRSQILQQGSTAVLMQANQQPALALQLLNVVNLRGR